MGRKRGGASQRPHLNGVHLGGRPGFGGRVQLAAVVAGDDEDNRGGAERHLLLGPGDSAARLGQDDGSDGAPRRRQRRLFETALQPGEARAEQPQQTAPELRRGRRDRRLKGGASMGKQTPPQALAASAPAGLAPISRISFTVVVILGETSIYKQTRHIQLRAAVLE